MRPAPRRSWRIAIAAAFAFAIAFSAGAAPTLDRREDDLTDAERRAADAVVADATARLPEAWSRALPRLTLAWRTDMPLRVAGHYDGRGIRLRRALLANGRAADAGDPARRAAVAALLHELAHAWDRSVSGGLSRDARLLDLAGWPASPLTSARGRHNDFRDRSPDPYELDSPAEFVAVNLEHVLLDADYACRRPALYAYFATRMALPPSGSCARPTFVQPDAATPVLTLDPARVYAVDYLLAEPDSTPMSRWGHAMLRLVVCAPGHTPGPACRLDLDSHVVLSFRAFVDDVQVSSWRGLTGRYPARLFVLPLTQVVDEYTKVELRGLRSVPLTLSRTEIADVVARAAQVHWSYDGRYRFVTNNCAVETWRLLHDAVPRIADARVGSLSPTGLLRRLQRAGLVDAVPNDRTEAVRLGYRFESQGAYYTELYDTARMAMSLPARDVVAWWSLDPAQRAVWLERADLPSAAALLVLENAALRREELRALSVVKRRLTDADHTALREALQVADALSRPSLQLPNGYGVPQPSEIDTLRAKATTLAAEWQHREGVLHDAAHRLLPNGDRDRLDALRANVQSLGEHLRTLAKSAGAGSD